MERTPVELEKLEHLLHQTPERQIPADLHERIMSEIISAESPTSLIQRLRRWRQRIPLLRFQSLNWGIAAGMAVAAFWLGTLVGMENQVQLVPTLAENSELAPFSHNARANFLVGRGLLEAGEKSLALQFFHQAVLQEPRSAEYGHWQGLAYWQLGDRDNERQSYQQSIARQPDYIPALLNLGHNMLESGDYRKSLAQYDKVLQLNPYEQTALYNRALNYHLLEDYPREQEAFIQYLHQYRSDKWAYRAVEHLQHLGAFQYRNYLIGNRKIVINQDILLGPALPARQLELERIVRWLEKSPSVELHLIVYSHNDKEKGKMIAEELRQQLQAIMGQNVIMPIRISWFDEPALVRTADGAERELTQGLLLFTLPFTTQRGNV